MDFLNQNFFNTWDSNEKECSHKIARKCDNCGKIVSFCGIPSLNKFKH